MNNTPTYRQGRTLYTGDKESGGNFFSSTCKYLLGLVFLIGTMVLFISSEKSYHGTIMSLYAIVEEGVGHLNESSKPGDLVHFISDVRAGLVETIDEEFNVAVKGALNMRRETEYCQWRELKRESCDTCKRDITNSDGSESTETYGCNCYIKYSYVKGWNPHLILSLTFDQPAAHHNPSRNPFPSTSFIADTAIVSSGNVLVNLPPTLVQNTKATYHKVIWNPQGLPPPPNFFTKYVGSFFLDATKYEKLSELRGSEQSIAARSQNFIYVDQGGFFFSPYEETKTEKLFKHFMQFMEGTLFDYQFGDLIQSCTPGDIRISYKVQDPKYASVLGQISDYDVKSKTFKLSSMNINTKITYQTNNMNKKGTSETTTVGFIHEGEKSIEEMIQKEQYDSFVKTTIIRILLLVWAIPVSVLIGVFLGKDVNKCTFSTKASSVLSVWSFGLALVWFIYWGVGNGKSYNDHDKQIVAAFTCAVVFGAIAMNHTKVRKKSV